MATVVRRFGAEMGIFSTAGGGICDFISGGPQASAAAARSGGLGLRCSWTGAGGERYIQWLESGSLTDYVFSYYTRTSALPGAGVGPTSMQMRWADDGVGFSVRVARLDSAGNFKTDLHDTAGTVVASATGPAISLDTWYRIDCHIRESGTTLIVDWQVNGVAQTQVSFDYGGVLAAQSIDLGGSNGTTNTLDLDTDDFVLSNTAGDYPLGEYKVLGYNIDSVGTHNLDAATSLHFFKSLSAVETALTTSETTSWQAIDEVGTPDADWILLKAAAGAPSLPVFQAVASHSGNPTTAPSATLGTTAANDVLICIVTSGGSNTKPTLGGTYSGGAWTEIDGGQLTTTGYVVAYWSRCTGNHTGQTVNSTTVDSGSLTVARYNNVLSTATPIGANKIESITTNAANPGLSAFTTTTANSKVVLVVGADDNLAVLTAATAGGNAMSVRAAPASSGGADSQVGVADRDQAAAGTTGAFATTWGANAAGTGKYLLAFELLGAPSLTQPTNTWYTEHGFEDSAESVAPSGGVSAYIAIRNDSGSVANSITAKLRANGNETDIFSGDIGGTTNLYKRLDSNTAPGGAAWTDTIFDGATLRWGYSNDADSTPRLQWAVLEAAFPVGGSLSAALGTATSTASALAIGRAKKAAVGIAAASSAALAIGASRAFTISTASETDSAQVLTGRKIRAVTLASEVDTARGLGDVRAVLMATEIDTAQSFGRRKALLLGVATSTASSLAIGKRKVKSILLASETDASQSLGRRKALTLGIATAASSALAFGRRKVKVLGLGAEADSSRPITLPTVTLGFPTETDSAQSFGALKRKSVTLATETDSSIALGRRKTKTITFASETDTSRPFGSKKRLSLVLASEADSAQVLGKLKRKSIGIATQAQSALALGKTRGHVLGTAGETDVSIAITTTFVTIRFLLPADCDPITLTFAETDTQTLSAEACDQVTFLGPVIQAGQGYRAGMVRAGQHVFTIDEVSLVADATDTISLVADPPVSA